MSFYVYYGKLGKDLLVAILPNGTVEVDDKLYLSSRRGFFSYRAREVNVAKDGEDSITFADAHASYVAVSKKGYQEIELVRTIKNEKVTATLIRKYDQPKEAATSKNEPHVWTGSLDFHEWAKNEEVVVIAPKGLGNKKPIVAIWQWTKDSNKEQGTLSHSVSEQKSESASPGKFSFQQNTYYTVTCEVGSKGLDLKLKGPADQGASNAEVAQKLLKPAKIDIGAEARFTPARATQTRMEMDCSFPPAQPYISRVNRRLPFPTGLIESLQHTAAYLDHAGGLAKHANSAFDKLYAVNEKLEERIQAKDKTLAELSKKIKSGEDSNKDLTDVNRNLNADVVKERENVVKERKEKEAAEDKLKNVLAQLAASEARVKRLQRAIDADKLADIQREKTWQEHHAEDMDAYQTLEQALEDAKVANHNLKEDLYDSNEKAKSLKADLDHTQSCLQAAETQVCGLMAEVKFWKRRVEKLEEELHGTVKELELAVKDRDHFREETAQLQSALTAKRAEVESLKIERDTLKKKLQDSEKVLETTSAELRKAQKDVADRNNQITSLRLDVSARERRLAAKERECERLEKQVSDKDQDKDDQEKSFNEEIERKDQEIRDLRAEMEGTKDISAPVPVVDALKDKTVTVTMTEVKADA